MNSLAIRDDPARLADIAKLVFAGIGMFFCIDGLITLSCDELAARRGHTLSTIRDHPPSSRRLSEAKRFFIECQANDAVFEMYDRIVEPIIDMQGDNGSSGVSDRLLDRCVRRSWTGSERLSPA
jgi:hypothetical protein